MYIFRIRKGILQYRRFIYSLLAILLITTTVIVIFSVRNTRQSAPINIIKTNGEDDRNVWQKEIIVFIKKHGIKQTLAYVAKRSRQDPRYRVVCHDLMHIVGREAYMLFSQGKRISVSIDASVCSYGFYHGVMETWIGKGGDMTQAGAFCSMIDETLRTLSPNTYYQCWHGIGHGAAVPHDTKIWGNIEAMVAPALALCKKATQDDELLANCITGAYGGVAGFILDGSYGLHSEGADPLGLCMKAKGADVDHCVGAFMPVLYKQYDRSIQMAWKNTMERIDAPHLDSAANSLGSVGALERIPEITVMDDCRQMGGSFADSCMRGYRESKKNI